MCGAVYSLNDDLKSRVRLIPLSYPNAEELRTIVTEAAQELPEPRIVEHVLTLATETQTDALDYQLSPRDVVQILEDICWVGLEKALWIATGKFEEDDRAVIYERILSTFGVDLAPAKTSPAKT